MKIWMKTLMNLDSKPMRIVALTALLIAFMSIFMSIASHATEKITILVIGDSLSSGYGLETSETWVELLAQEFARRGKNIDLRNDSISGDTTAGGVARLPAALRQTQPDWVIIQLGGNDGLRGNSLAAMQQNLLKMVRLTRAHGATPILFGMKLPPNYGQDYTEGFEQVYQQVATISATPLLPLFIHGIENDMSLFQPDRLHPNAQAQPIIANNVSEFIEALF